MGTAAASVEGGGQQLTSRSTRPYESWQLVKFGLISAAIVLWDLIFLSKIVVSIVNVLLLFVSWVCSSPPNMFTIALLISLKVKTFKS